MFGHKTVDDDADHHLLGQDDTHKEQSHGNNGWEQGSSTSEQNISSVSEIWDQDPLQGEIHELQEVPTAPIVASKPAAQWSQDAPTKRSRVQLEDHGEAATELEEEFKRIFSPIKKDQQEKARFHAELDAACAAYSARLEEMKERQREREGTIENPWLIARRRREWERFLVRMRSLGILLTCFWGGTVASLEEVPPEVPWPPPHLMRMKEHHADERRALCEAHIAVVEELHTKYKLEASGKHVCVERRLLIEVLGESTTPSDDMNE